MGLMKETPGEHCEGLKEMVDLGKTGYLQSG